MPSCFSSCYWKISKAIYLSVCVCVCVCVSSERRIQTRCGNLVKVIVKFIRKGTWYNSVRNMLIVQTQRMDSETGEVQQK
jgi:hypothetical protein